MNSVINESLKAVIWTVCAVIFIEIVGFVVSFVRVNNYENQVVRYVQTAGGVTPAVMAKADQLSKNTYQNHFKLVPHGSGKAVTQNGKSYDAVYPTEWSTDENNVPIFPALDQHQEGKIEYVTEKGCLMSLLDHPSKLFAGKPKDFKVRDKIPSDIEATKVKEVKPLGYIDKNYFFDFASSANNDQIHVWSYKLAHPKELTHQDEPDRYIYDTDSYQGDKKVAAKTRDFTTLLKVKINADDPKVHFKDKSVKGMQTVRLASGGNDLKGVAYLNRWSDIKANSYPHDYGSKIKYDIQIDIPFLMFTERFGVLNKIHVHSLRQSITTSLYRELKH